MSKARLVITAVIVEKRPVSEVARAYGVARSWVYALLARYRAEGEAAFEPRSRRPKTSPSAISGEHRRADRAAAQGPGRAGPGRRAADHLLAPATPPPHPGVAGDGQPVPDPAGLVTPEPRKRPKSSYIRFAAEQPNECWQSDFTHYPLAGGTGTEILTWLDDHSRLRAAPDRHSRVTGPIVVGRVPRRRQPPTAPRPPP